MKLCFSHIGGDAEVWKFGEVPNNKTWIHCAGNISWSRNSGSSKVWVPIKDIEKQNAKRLWQKICTFR
jgi:hypothetical protein